MPRRRNDLDVSCGYCGRRFRQHSKGKGVFCSRSCYALWQHEHLIGENNPNFKGGNIERICAFCGKTFFAQPRQVKRGDGKFCSYSCSSKSRLPRLLASAQLKPTQLESKLMKIFVENRLPFSYTGNGQTFIGGRCPDFLHENKPKVVEAFGSYWHDRRLNPKIRKGATEEETKAHYTKFGFDCQVVWDRQVKTDYNAVVNELEIFARKS